MMASFRQAMRRPVERRFRSCYGETARITEVRDGYELRMATPEGSIRRVFPSYHQARAYLMRLTRTWTEV